MATKSHPPVVLFGYDSSPFTQKVRLALRLKRIPYNFVKVSSMMPRPVLSANFHLTYRKIPVLAIGRDIYIDTSLICEALEFRFRNDEGHGQYEFGTLYPPAEDGRRNRAIVRGFASYWTDRPLFRVTTGFIPGSVWSTQFGVDRANLIGHKLDPKKLEAKLPQNLSGLDMHLSILEEQLRESKGSWLFSTQAPGLADISLYYQLDWGNDMAAGKGLGNLTEGGTSDANAEGTSVTFNKERYPAILQWFESFKAYIEMLPQQENVVGDAEAVGLIRESSLPEISQTMVPTASPPLESLDNRIDLVRGTVVSVAPDDTGRNHPTIGTLIALSPEEFVIQPAKIDSSAPPVETRLHFPRLGFTVRKAKEAKM